MTFPTASIVSYRREGFSLVEVVIALGITSFVIIAIIGLLSVGLQTSRESAEDMNLALMGQTTASLLRSRTFTNVLNSTNFGDTNADYFFDANGALTRDTSGAPATSADTNSLFACTISRRTPSLAPLSATNFIYLQYKITWPLSAPAANRKEKVGVISLANYE
jgi:uncharacterized protein (TIGR02598 family)